jgi:hypothetical protein
MPPAKSMVNQERFEYSGVLSRRPSLIWPCLLSAAHTRNASQMFTPRMKNQPRLETIHDRPAANASAMGAGKTISRSTKTKVHAAETKKMVGSVLSPSRCARPSTSSS